VRSAGEGVSTLDLLGPGLTLFTGPRHERWRAAAGAPVTSFAHDVDAGRALHAAVRSATGHTGPERLARLVA
jgi:hypothetical protein